MAICSGIFLRAACSHIYRAAAFLRLRFFFFGIRHGLHRTIPGWTRPTNVGRVHYSVAYDSAFVWMTTVLFRSVCFPRHQRFAADWRCVDVGPCAFWMDNSQRRHHFAVFADEHSDGTIFTMHAYTTCNHSCCATRYGCLLYTFRRAVRTDMVNTLPALVGSFSRQVREHAYWHAPARLPEYMTNVARSCQHLLTNDARYLPSLKQRNAWMNHPGTVGSLRDCAALPVPEQFPGPARCVDGFYAAGLPL